MCPAEPFELEHFVHAQAKNSESALAEIRRSVKRGYWTRFIFSQIARFGQRLTAQLYAIASIEGARLAEVEAVIGARAVWISRRSSRPPIECGAFR